MPRVSLADCFPLVYLSPDAIAMCRPCLAIVDDHEPLVQMLAFYVQAQDWTAFALTKPEEAFEFLGQHPVDALLCDLQMPAMSGLQLLARLRETGWSGVALMMTGTPHLIAQTDRNRYKIAAVLSKPFRVSELLTLLDTVRADRPLTSLESKLVATVFSSTPSTPIAEAPDNRPA